jgi:hypothetical protein
LAGYQDPLENDWGSVSSKRSGLKAGFKGPRVQGAKQTRRGVGNSGRVIEVKGQMSGFRLQDYGSRKEERLKRESKAVSGWSYLTGILESWNP